MRNILLDLLRSVKWPGARPGFGRLRDGFWWRKLSDSARFAYVIGYLDALKVGRAASGAARASDTAHSREKAELDAAKVTAVLDEFFADSDNWHMALPSAMFYVIKWQENPDADHSELLRRLRGPSDRNRV